MKKFYFVTMEDAKTTDRNWFDTAEPTESEIKAKKIVVGKIDYDLVSIDEIKEYMEKHPKYIFYESLLENVDEDARKYLLDNINITKHSEAVKAAFN